MAASNGPSYVVRMRHEPELQRWALTEEEKSDREMVRETGKRAKEAKG